MNFRLISLISVYSIIPHIYAQDVTTDTETSSDAKDVTPEQIAENRAKILAENPRLETYLMSPEKSSSFLRSEKVRIARDAESREEVRYTETQNLRDEHVKFEAAIESLAYAIQANEDVVSKNFEICKEARTKIYSKVNMPVAVYHNGAAKGSKWASFNLKGQKFVVFFG